MRWREVVGALIVGVVGAACVPDREPPPPRDCIVPVRGWAGWHGDLGEITWTGVCPGEEHVLPHVRLTAVVAHGGAAALLSADPQVAPLPLERSGLTELRDLRFHPTAARCDADCERSYVRVDGFLSAVQRGYCDTAASNLAYLFCSAEALPRGTCATRVPVVGTARWRGASGVIAWTGPLPTEREHLWRMWIIRARAGGGAVALSTPGAEGNVRLTPEAWTDVGGRMFVNRGYCAGHCADSEVEVQGFIEVPRPCR